jgi:hypothetical protein
MHPSIKLKIPVHDPRISMVRRKPGRFFLAQLSGNCSSLASARLWTASGFDRLAPETRSFIAW